MMKLLPVTLTIFLLAGCSAADTGSSAVSGNISLEPGWVLSGFDAPESVISDGAKGYFVSNVNGGGSEKDGNGYISRITAEGTLIEKKWAAGLDAPKGMALQNGTLYVSDIDTLVMLNADTGEEQGRITIADAGFLNDVAANEKGVFVSDSGKSRIHRLEGDALPVWMENPRFNRINGLLPQRGRMLVTTMAQGELLAVDWDDRSITSIAAGMANGDGLGERPDGSFLVSSWTGQIWHVRKGENTPTLLQDTSEGDVVQQNDVLFENDRALAPNWGQNTVREYKILAEK